ncbi:MAG: hypothetical protein KF687_03240 [Cyclobacteriaceae bacterium]|nr:hypothetical protein [Cyclobacteriaceae bacterium]
MQGYLDEKVDGVQVSHVAALDFVFRKQSHFNTKKSANRLLHWLIELLIIG